MHSYGQPELTSIVMNADGLFVGMARMVTTATMSKPGSSRPRRARRSSSAVAGRGEAIELSGAHSTCGARLQPRACMHAQDGKNSRAATCGPLRHVECAEAGNTDRLSGGERIENDVYHGFYRLPCRCLA